MFSSRNKPSPYEVRCPRCDVSFPVEQRVCIHCGGRTGPSGDLGFDPTSTLEAADPSRATSAEPIDPFASPDPGSDQTASESADSPFPIGLPGDHVEGDEGPFSAETEGSGRSGLGSVLQSMGGIIWVLLLIGFSLARSCGE